MSKIQQQLHLEGSAEKPAVNVKPKRVAKTLSSQELGAHHSWMWMRFRCLNPKCHGYHNYGGRGIKVCDRWLTFENFLADMGPRPEAHVIDRINPNGNYEPSNCRWIPSRLSTRTSRKVEIPFVDGEPERVRTNKVHRRWVERNREHRHNYNSEYWEHNKPRLTEKYRKWQSEHREQRNKYQRELIRSRPDLRLKRKHSQIQYYAANKEKLKANAKRYVSENREKIKARQRAYYLKNRERLIAEEMARYWKRKSEKDKSALLHNSD